MDSTKISIFKQMYEKCLTCFLKGENCVGLPTDSIVNTNVMVSDLLDKSCKWKFSKKKVGAPLKLTDLPQRIGAWSVTSLLDSCGWISG